MKIIKDPVHGYISLSEDELIDIVDTRYFQRLRFIAQMSSTQMVYPSARHSRFEHSLGVFHLSKSIFQNIIKQSISRNKEFTKDINPTELETIEKTLRYASLLHDIGHFPFSHLGEKFSSKDKIIEQLENEHKFLTEIIAADKKYNQIGKKIELAKKDYLDSCKEHELMSCLLILSKIKDKIKKRGINPYEVCAFILGFSFEGLKNNKWRYNIAAQILNSCIDADRLDYILRDNKMTGAALATIDSERMVMAYTTCDKKLVLSDKALSVIKNFLLARESDYLWICQHHKVVYSNALVKKMIRELPLNIRDKLFSYDAIVNQYADDFCMMYEIRNQCTMNTTLKEYYRRYVERDFLKSCWKHFLDFSQLFDDETCTLLIQYIRGHSEEIEEYLIKKLKIEKEKIIVDNMADKKFSITDFKNIFIDCEGKAKSIFELRLYDEEKIEKYIPYVYLPKDYINQGIKELKTFAQENPIKIIV